MKQNSKPDSKRDTKNRVTAARMTQMARLIIVALNKILADFLILKSHTVEAEETGDEKALAKWILDTWMPRFSRDNSQIPPMFEALSGMIDVHIHHNGACDCGRGRSEILGAVNGEDLQNLGINPLEILRGGGVVPLDLLDKLKGIIPASILEDLKTGKGGALIATAMPRLPEEEDTNEVLIDIQPEGDKPRFLIPGGGGDN